MMLEQAIRQFLDHQLANGRSPHTIYAYKHDLELLVFDLTPDIRVDSIDRSDIDQFFISEPATYQQDGLLKSASTVNRIRSSVKAFFRWLTETGYCDHNPAIGIHICRNTRKPPVFLTDIEKQKLLKTIRAHKGWQVNRDLMMVKLSLNTGIRLSELVNLDVDDVDLIEKRITIQAKGGQTVTRFLNTKVRSALSKYLKERRKVITDSRALFLSQRLRRITTRQVQRRLEMWVSKAGINKRVTPHVLRHSFATMLYAKSSNILAVQHSLGHSSLNTTTVYAHLLDETLEDAMETL